jgi:hypothetical protein
MTLPMPVGLIESGIDWLTVTSGDKKRGKLLAQRAIKIARQEEQAGNEKRFWAQSGYQGFKVGGVQTGERHDGLIVRLSSHVAREHWKPIAALADNCSRIDLQVTLRNEQRAAQVIASEFKRVKRFREGNQRAPTLSMFQSSDGSSTLYIGKRVSEQFGRIYDKGKETGLSEYDNAVRYEVEIKGDRATQLGTWLSAHQNPDVEIEGMVWEFFAKRGCSLRLPESGRGHIAGDYEPKFNLDYQRLSRRLSDSEERLAWLSKVLRRTAQFLVTKGLGDQLLEGLGLSVDKHGKLVLSTEVQKRESE